MQVISASLPHHPPFATLSIPIANLYACYCLNIDDPKVCDNYEFTTSAETSDGDGEDAQENPHIKQKKSATVVVQKVSVSLLDFLLACANERNFSGLRHPEFFTASLL